MIKTIKERLKRIVFLKRIVRLIKKYFFSDPKIISLLLTFDMYAPNSDGNPRLKSKLTKNTIIGIFDSINQFCKELNDSKKEILKVEDLNINNEEKKSIEELKLLLNKYGSDKAYKHQYHILYGKILTPRETILNILEIGLGTNKKDIVSNMGLKGKPGASLRAFRDFCPNAEVMGADIDNRILFNECRIQTFQVDQTSNNSLDKLKDKCRDKFDLIIDDGLHSPDANINTLRIALSLIKNGGSIVIEDINPKTIDIWLTISNLLPTNIFSSEIIEAKGALLFFVKKL